MYRYDKNYSLTVAVSKASENRSASMTKCVGDIFDDNGVLLYNKMERLVLELHNSLASEKKKR